MLRSNQLSYGVVLNDESSSSTTGYKDKAELEFEEVLPIERKAAASGENGPERVDVVGEAELEASAEKTRLCVGKSTLKIPK